MSGRGFVTVVSGLPRSGTSLAMQMLEAGGVPALTDRVRTPDDDNPRGYFEFERVKRLRTDKAWLDDARGKAVKIIHALLTELPEGRDYRVLFMRRDPGEVIRSQAAMLARSGHAGAAMPPERLAAVYAQQLAGVERWMAARAGLEVLDVPYAGLVADPGAWAGRFDAFLGGGLDAGAMAAAVDPALYRNRG